MKVLIVILLLACCSSHSLVAKKSSLEREWQTLLRREFVELPRPDEDAVNFAPLDRLLTPEIGSDTAEVVPDALIAADLADFADLAFDETDANDTVEVLDVQPYRTVTVPSDSSVVALPLEVHKKKLYFRRSAAGDRAFQYIGLGIYNYDGIARAAAQMENLQRSLSAAEAADADAAAPPAQCHIVKRAGNTILFLVADCGYFTSEEWESLANDLRTIDSDDNSSVKFNCE